MSVAPDLQPIRGGEVLAPPTAEELLGQCWNVRELDGGLVEATVPMDLIAHDDVPVNWARVHELADSIQKEAECRGSNGLWTRASLAQVDGVGRLYITDGFHRDGAMQLLKRDSIDSTIRLHTTPEEVLDLRILAATGHNEVMFARVVEWVDDSWSKSPWAGRITAEQAFGLCRENVTGERLGLSTSEAQAIRDWATQKGKQWHLAPTTVHGYLSTAENADPALTKAVRQQLGTASSLTLTKGHLDAVADIFPKQYDRQRLAASVILGYKMGVDRAKAALNIMDRARTFEEMVELVNSTPWSTVKAPKSSPSKASSTTRNGSTAPTGRQPDKNHTVDLSADGSAATTTEPTKPASARTPQAPAAVTAGSDVIKRLSRDNVLTGLQLARYAFDRMVMGGGYVAPIVKSTSERALRVTYGDDPEVAMLARAVDTEALREQFAESSRKVEQNAFAMLEQRHHLAGTEASDIVRKVRSRIIRDMAEGDLRLFTAGSPLVFQQLLFNGINDEVSRRRINVTQLQTVPHVEHPVSVSIEEVVAAIPAMQPTMRKIVLMHGVLGMSALTTARLLTGDMQPSKVVRMAEMTGSTIKDAVRAHSA